MAIKEKKADDHSELGMVKITQVKASHPFAEFDVVRIQVGQFIHLCEREREHGKADGKIR